MYRTLCDFRDLEDGHLYKAGDQFPHDGREISEQRIEALITGRNKANKAVIEKVEQTIKETPKPKANRRKTAKK